MIVSDQSSRVKFPIGMHALLQQLFQPSGIKFGEIESELTDELRTMLIKKTSV